MFSFFQHSPDLVHGERSQVARRQSNVARKLAIIAIVVCTFALIVYASNPPPTSLAITCPTTTTPVQLGSGLMHGRTFVFLGTKGNRVNNTGTVWIQNVAANDSNGIPLTPGQIISFSSQRAFDASDFWIDAETANDGVVCWIQDRP